MCWRGRNDELDYKMNLIERYRDLKEKKGMNDQQIITLFPEMQQIMLALQNKNTTREEEDDE